ncbi:MAG TPA: transcriptional activator NhaR [Pirellulales bacterium]
MDWLNYHHLLYFWQVAREGSVVRAARALHLSQPTVSAQVRALERALGQRLFQKQGRGLVLTEVGRQVLRYAEEIFALGRELTEVVGGNKLAATTRFAVGISDALPKMTTYKLLEPALVLEPRLRIVMKIDKTDRLLTQLAEHSLDLVLVDGRARPDMNVRAFTHLLGESGVSIFATRKLARQYRRNFPQSLHGAPLLVQTTNTSLRRTLDQWFYERNLVPQIVGEVEDTAILQVLGQEGVGLFAAPSVVEKVICKQHDVCVLGQLAEAKERFYAISVERRLRHPAVVAISQAARKNLFVA